MPADDLVLNVRQIGNYPPVTSAPPIAALLMQVGIGGAYVSISPQALVSTALQTGGDMAIAGKLSAQAFSGGNAQFSNASVNLLWAQKANVVNFNATCGTINCVPIATVNDLAALQATGLVSSFNLRTGAVMLSLADITGAGGAPIVSPNFSGVPSAPTAALGSSDGQLATTAFVQNAVTAGTTGVSSFNTRTGAVTLQAADLTAVGGALLASPTFTGVPAAPTAAPGSNTAQLATTAFVAAAVAAAEGAGVATFNGRTGAVLLLANDVSAAGGALLASPAFTGAPTAVNPLAGDNSTRLATTAFVMSAVAGAGYAPLVSPNFSGVPTAPTAAPGSNTTQLATTAFVLAAITAGQAGVATFNGRSGVVTLLANDISGAGGALLASPIFTGVPAAPTAAPGVSSPQLATTAFVAGALPVASSTVPLMDGTAAVGNGTTWARNNHVHPTDTSRAAQASLANYLPLAGGALTGSLAGTTATLSGTVTGYAYNVNNTAGVAHVLVGQTSGVPRWSLMLGDGGTETGGSAGSDFVLQALNDGGGFNSNPIACNRATAVCTFWAPIVNGSDRRIKREVEEIKDALGIVQKLTGVYFKSIDGDKRHVGLVAQDVAPHLPEAVFASAVNRDQAKAYGLPEGEPFLGVAYGNIVAVLIEAVKMLTARVGALEAQ